MYVLLRLKHFHNTFTQVTDIVFRNARHVDTAGTDGVNGEFFSEAIDLFGA